MEREYHIPGQAVAKAMDVLLELSRFSRPASLAEVSRAVGLPKSTTHRLLQCLQQKGFIRQTEGDGLYGLGFRLLELAGTFLREVNFPKSILDRLRVLRDGTEETSNLVIRDQGSAVFLHACESPKTLRLTSMVGQRRPLHSTAAGKIFLSCMTPEQLEQFVGKHGLPALTNKTLTSVERLRRHLRQIQKEGVSVDDEETEEGIRCVAAGIYGVGGILSAAVSISGPVGRLTMKKIREVYAPLVKQAGDDMSRALGFAASHESAPFAVGDGL
ncbi:MAG: IclR family transcriptional regulator [Candidatus Tectomicrobia bacterium]|nr:IclR family transcriptional regulator [Candidatus Tectomicrobia bacterium]